MFIEDGSGSGTRAKVNKGNRLSVVAQTLSTTDALAFLSQAYSFLSGILTLTTAGESGLIFIKNNNQNLYLRIDRFILSAGKSTGGNPGDVTWKCYQNPTTGTLISAGTIVVPVNHNFGVSLPAQADALSGAEGKTITNGTPMFGPLIGADNRSPLDFLSGILIPAGQTVAVSVTPPTGNTSIRVAALIIASFVDSASVA